MKKIIYLSFMFILLIVSCATTAPSQEIDTTSPAVETETEQESTNTTPEATTQDIEGDNTPADTPIETPAAEPQSVDYVQQEIVKLPDYWKDLTVYCWDESLGISVGEIAYAKKWSDKSKIRVSTPLFRRKTKLTITMFPFDEEPLYDYTFTFRKTEAGAELLSVESAYGRIMKTNETDVVKNVFQTLGII